MVGKDQGGIRWMLANAGKEPKGPYKALAERLIQSLMKPPPKPNK